MKLNNKGFAISGILYPIFILFLVLILGILGVLGATKVNLDRINKEIELELNGTTLTPSFTIQGSYVQWTVGQELNLLSNVEAQDYLGNKIPQERINYVASPSFDYNTKGTYNILYEVLDSKGRLGFFVRTIEVVDPINVELDILVVGGGGGGGKRHGGGGGAGGVVYKSSYVVNVQSYPITVGEGGMGAGPGSSPSASTNGQNSTALGLIAIGGGRGGFFSDTTTSFNAGGSGASGGGGAAPLSGTALGGSATQPGTNSGVQNDAGTSGGSAVGGAGWAGAGGGGASTAGGSRSGNNGGAGGAGLSFASIFGTSYGQNGVFGGGGGGAGGDGGTAGAGGIGGGGAGTTGDVQGIHAAANTGGGGGGARSTNAVANITGGNGGSGIVIIRYFGSPRATGGTITSFNGYTIHAFTASGTFTILE